ncbi:MAG TPA: bifunctional transaldolase/phosoglucose isomerase, partial [Thermoanaerobaculia bacterium]|nr:bifunctional transaldolase/phosoglucose isomerase [Thermoanaerobaculia bacterium]
MRWSLAPDLDAAVRAGLAAWDATGSSRRLWARDATLWTGGDEGRWLGWLDIVEQQRGRLGELRDFAALVREAGLRHALLLGMGGSSLGPEVLASVFAPAPGQPELLVLDSTDPAQVRAFEARLDLARTLFIVSSKSGTTLEPNILQAHFFARAQAVLGRAPGDRFVAITDPGSQLESAARQAGFRRVFHGRPEIGGRYSVLSDFGLVPAAFLGVELESFLERAARRVEACGPDVPAAQNPGVALGLALAAAARAGRDKVTLVASPPLRRFGAWLEQLLAESTGKQGKGLIPVDGERPGPAAVYGDDRLFVYVRVESEAAADQDQEVEALAGAGQAVVRLDVADRMELGAEFFGWEMATAVAGAALGIHPFDQPDVEASKTATRRLTAEVERTGALPEERPLLAEAGLRLFADPDNAAALRQAVAGAAGLAGVLRAHLERLRPGDYFALLAYVEMSAEHEAALQRLRHAVRDRKRVATCLGFGPRFLHSTGQAYKGGPPSGVFLQITCDDAPDLAVPGKGYTFGQVKAAQARGDFEVLAERGRRALRVHLG